MSIEELMQEVEKNPNYIDQLGWELDIEVDRLERDVMNLADAHGPYYDQAQSQVLRTRDIISNQIAELVRICHRLTGNGHQLT
jgi:hypothetical protein